MQYILKTQRSEEMKAIRRNHGLERFENREYAPRTDGISNTLTTVLKDNLIIVTYE